MTDDRYRPDSPEAVALELMRLINEAEENTRRRSNRPSQTR